MTPDPQQSQLLRQLPAVDGLARKAEAALGDQQVPRSVMLRAVRQTIADLRHQILQPAADPEYDGQASDGKREGKNDDQIDGQLLARVQEHIASLMQFRLRRVVNATGVVVHTNLGRSCLAPLVLEQLQAIATCYSNLEFNLVAGRRGSRYAIVEDLLCELSGAPAALVVNNNAAAVLLCLDTLARGREVPVSRGELVEIGGSFRIPDVMARSGAILKEVGTTNRTHLRDYAAALTDQTALLLKVHASNYSVVGFTASVSLEQLVTLGQQHHLPVMEDLGSGTFIDFSHYGLMKEPTIQESVAAGASIVTFSGDKLLGGPQAGIIVGKTDLIDRLRRNQLARALRIDKLTLAALEGTLRLYRDPCQAVEQIPTLRMLTRASGVLERKAQQLQHLLEQHTSPDWRFEVIALTARAGGGALPLLAIPSQGLAVEHPAKPAHVIERALRRNHPPIIGRIEDDRFVMDVRTLQEEELELIRMAFENL